MAIQAGGIETYLDLNTGKFNSNLKKAQGQLDGFANHMKSAGSKISDIGGSMTKKMTLPLVGIGAAAIKTGMDFDQGMSQVEAISQASGEEMAMLEGLARDMGSQTKFSASEAAEGLTYMAMAGWKTEEMATALPAVLDLAAASGADLGTTSDIVTDALTAFNMGADEAVGFTDLLASASSNANTDVVMLGESFKYVAPVMGALGASADDTALALGLMANAGIKGSQSGTQLRTIMSSLIDPKQVEAMGEYGIELQKNADGSINLEGTLRNLRDALGELDEEQQGAAASTLFGREAMAGVLAIVNASEADYNKLAEATTNYDGAAKDMADTMQDNLAGSLESMKSKLEEAGIALAESLIPMMEKGVEWISNMVDKFNELDDEQREQIVKWGLMAAAAGPALKILGTGMGVVGGLASGVGKLTGVLSGTGGAVGLAGSLSALGPLAVGGVAVAGIVGISKVVKKLREDSEDLEKVNVEVADSFIDQAKELQTSIATFEELTEKADASNEELARLNELNQAITKSNNPGEIKRLQEEYDRLAEKTGLSKDELNQLYSANQSIIDQSPEVETSINRQGGEFVVSTEKAREYAKSLNDMSNERLDLELEKALRNEQAVLEENKQIEVSRNRLAEEKQGLQGMILKGEEDTVARMDETYERLKDINLTEEERNVLHKERDVLAALARGDQELAHQLYDEYLDLYGEELESMDSILEKNDLELDKVDILLSRKADLILAEMEIYETGMDGLKALDDKLEKNQEEITQLEEKKKVNGELTEEDRERLALLEDTNLKLEEGKLKILEETGLYTDLNELVKLKMDYANENTQAVINEAAELAEVEIKNNDILGALDEKSIKLNEQLGQLQANREEEGANKDEIDLQIASVERKIGQQAESKKMVLEELGLWSEVDDSIKEGITSEIEKGIAAGNTTKTLEGQGGQIEGNNTSTRIGIGLEEDRTKEAGKDVTKRVNATDNGTIGTLNRRAREPQSKVVSLIGRWAGKAKSFFGYAEGTPAGGHPGGLALVGDGGGEELIIDPRGPMFLSPPTDTFMELRKGTHVLSHEDTKSFFRNLPKYAQGTMGAKNILGSSAITNPRTANRSIATEEQNVNHNHNGTITFLGVNNEKQLVAATEQVITNNISSDGRRLPDRPKLIPI